VGFLVWTLLPGVGVLAGPKLPTPKTFRARREALIRKLGKSPVLIFGAESSQGFAPFRQNNRFYYLTGVTEPDAVLLLIPDSRREVLFLKPGDPRKERWEGPRLRPGKEAKKLTGFQEVLLRRELMDTLDRCLMGKESAEVFIPLSPEEIGGRIWDYSRGPLKARKADPLDGRTWREDQIRRKLVERYKGLEVKDASPTIRGLRVLKGREEMDAMREAGRISALGMVEAMKFTKAGVYEYEIAATMAYRARMEGGQGWAYAPIVGSGRNSLVLHYNLNNRKAKAGELVLMDAGFLWNFYGCDITRTFPVSGRFTPEQKKIYTELLGVQEEAIKRVHPGASLMKISNWVNGKLRALGYGKNLAHGLGHFVGMAVHDPGSYGTPLAAGHVLTIEPGLYFDDKGYGFRIEDTVLVTPNGCEVLSAGVPKAAAAIEALMKKKR
jgi:Xaa-Pro aminopeptidase